MTPSLPVSPPCQLLDASLFERRALIIELLEFVEGTVIPFRIDDRDKFYNSLAGEALVTHSNTLVRYYDRCDEDLQIRIAACCDVQSYEQLKYNEEEESHVV